MPRYHHTESQNVEESSLEEEKVIKKNSKLLLFLGFTYFALSCGLEGFFQSQTYTFGICGPHKISPEKAASLTSVYFGTFLAGRFSGVLLSTRFKPLIMIIISIGSCILSALLLVLTAKFSLESLFFGTGAIGFFVSFQFASGLSWLSAEVDLTGRSSCIVFLGAYIGWLIFPPLSGIVFFSPIGPMGLYYLTLGITSFHFIIFLLMLKVVSTEQ